MQKPVDLTELHTNDLCQTKIVEICLILLLRVNDGCLIDLYIALLGNI